MILAGEQKVTSAGVPKVRPVEAASNGDCKFDVAQSSVVAWWRSAVLDRYWRRFDRDSLGGDVL
jgi:hypothetical protein